MPREASGELRKLATNWAARVTIQGREREEYELPFSHAQETEARERCTLLAGLARRLRKAGAVADAPALLRMASIATTPAKLDGVLGAVAAICSGGTVPDTAAGPVTFEEFATDWTSGKLHEKWPDYVKSKRSVQDDIDRLENWVYPVVRHVALSKFKTEHAEAVMRALPAWMSPSSRRHVAQLMHRVLGLAVYPAKLIPSSPLPRGFLPKLGAPKALQYLYCDEDAKLLSATDDVVPLAYRVLFGVLDREGLRSGEATKVRWSDLDLDRGAISLDENKTDDPRSWALDPGVVRTLDAWRDMRDDTEPNDHVFIDEYGRPAEVEGLVDKFRGYLKAAGVDRPALYETGPNRRPIRVHDLRATFVTLSLANGKTEAWVCDRTGHTTSQMLNKYRRAARSVAELGQGALIPLDHAIPEFRPPAADCPPIAPEFVGQEGLEPSANGLRDRGLTPRNAETPRKQAQGQPEIARAEGGLGQSEGKWGDADSVEMALADALTKATAAGAWDVVGQLARELEARRVARAGVVKLDVERAKRGR